MAGLPRSSFKGLLPRPIRHITWSSSAVGICIWICETDYFCYYFQTKKCCGWSKLQPPMKTMWCRWKLSVDLELGLFCQTTVSKAKNELSSFNSSFKNIFYLFTFFIWIQLVQKTVFLWPELKSQFSEQFCFSQFLKCLKVLPVLCEKKEAQKNVWFPVCKIGLPACWWLFSSWWLPSGGYYFLLFFIYHCVTGSTTQ